MGVFHICPGVGGNYPGVLAGGQGFFANCLKIIAGDPSLAGKVLPVGFTKIIIYICCEPVPPGGLLFHHFKIKNLMEITTLAATAVGYLVSWLKNSKGGQQASDDFTSALWDWIKPIFIEDDKSLKKLEADPEKPSNQSRLAADLSDALEAQPEKAAELSALLDQLKAAGKQPAQVNILDVSGSHNIINQGNEGSTITINTGGSAPQGGPFPPGMGGG